MDDKNALLAAALDWLPQTGCSKAALKQISDDHDAVGLKSAFAAWVAGSTVLGVDAATLQAVKDCDSASDGFLAEYDGDAIVACAAAQIAGRLDVARRLNPRMK